MGIRFTRGKRAALKVGATSKEIARRTNALASKVELALSDARFVVGATLTLRHRDTGVAHSVVILTSTGDASVTPKYGTGRTAVLSWSELLRDFV